MLALVSTSSAAVIGCRPLTKTVSVLPAAVIVHVEVAALGRLRTSWPARSRTVA